MCSREVIYISSFVNISKLRYFNDFDIFDDYYLIVRIFEETSGKRLKTETLNNVLAGRLL